MGAPKSVIKINKSGVQYVSSVDKCQYFIFELSRAALRDVGKFVSKKFKENYYSVFKRHSGDAGKATKYSVVSGKNTKYPRVQIGVKAGQVDGFYAYFQEFGSSKQKKLGILSKTVNENIPEIVKIESQYLSNLENEAKALSLIEESDMEGDADE